MDPLICPKCQGKMRVIGAIEDEVVIKKILKHLGLWLPKRSPRVHAPPQAVRIDYLDSQIPSADDYLIRRRRIIPLTAGRIKKTYSVLTGQVRPKMPKKHNN